MPSRSRSRSKSKKPKKGRKRLRLRKIPLALKAHSFVERVEDVITLSSSTLNTSGNLSSCYAREFKLDDIPQVASYKILFDDYVLNKVVMELRYDTYYTGTTTADVPVNPIYPQLLIKTDHNDASTSETWNDLKASEKSRLVQLRPSMGKPISHVIKPASQMLIYKTSVGTSAYGAKWGQVIRTIDSGVPHYGVKIQVQTNPPLAGALNLGKISIMYKYYFTMKNPE